MSPTRFEVSREPSVGTGLVSVDGRRFPLRAVVLSGRAQAGLATTNLRQEYTNPYEEPLEVLYTLPLPADGAVLGYTVTIGAKVIRGEVMRREEAQERYIQALESGRTAGLLEQARADTFNQSLGSLPPGQDVRVEIEVLHPLGFRPPTPTEEGLWEYRFPTVVGVRYQGEPGRVTDASQLDVERADISLPLRFECELSIADGEPEAIAPRSPSHAVQIDGAVESTRLRLADPSRLDRDLIVQWRALGRDVGVRLVEGHGLPGDDGRYAVLTLTPPQRPSQTFARDLTLLLDASGSMAGEPIELAKKVARRLIESLSPADRFEVVAFNMTATTLVDGLVAAGEQEIRTALDRLQRLQAEGGTEMARAVSTALRCLRADSQRQIVLLTDGYVGFEQEVVHEVLETLPAGARVHVVGIGAAPNRALTRGASRAGRGREILLSRRQDVDAETERLLRGLAAPVLTEVRVLGPGLRTLAAARPRDVFAGMPLLLPMELTPKGGSIEVRGNLAGSETPWRARLEAETRSAALDRNASLPLGALFGREAVEDCEALLAGESGIVRQRDVLEQIEALGLRHGIATRRTSLVAVAEEPSVDPHAPRRRERLAVELPAGVSAEGLGLGPGGPAGMWHASTTMDTQPLLGSLNAAVSRRPSAPRFKAMDLVEDIMGRIRSWRRRPGIAIQARILRIQDDLLVIEFEIPKGGMNMPGDGEILVVMTATEFPVRVAGKRSSKAGALAAGLTVRLALERLDGGAWQRGEELYIMVPNGKRGFVTLEVSS